MGNLYKRGGTYYADYYDAQRRRQQRSTRTGDRQVALARLREYELQTTDRGADSTEVLSNALDYFTNVAHAASPAATVRCYQQKAAHLSRLMGDTVLGRLDPEHVERYIATRLREGASKHTVHKELVVLRGALKTRKKQGGDPSIVPRFKAEYVPRENYLTPDQFMRLTEELVPVRPNAKPATLAAALDRRMRRTLYCLLIAFTSARRGELEKLRWEDVDLARGLIHVPKGKTVKRDVPITNVLRPWLEAMHAGTGPVVEPWGSVGRDMPAACARAGVPRCTPNDLRRTFASWQVQGGVPLKAIANLMGHKSTRMVDLVYGRLGPDDYRAAMDRMPGGCNAGVTDTVRNRGEHGAGGTAIAQAAITNSVEDSAISGGYRVPGDGVEPPTRGFSVRCSTS